MTVHLTLEEIKIIDEALVEWQNSPTREGLSSSILGTLLRGPGESEIQRRESIKQEFDEARKQVRARELQTMRLRLKLHEMSQRPAEFEKTS